MNLISSWRLGSHRAAPRSPRLRPISRALAILVALPGASIAADNEIQVLSEQYLTNLSVSYTLEGVPTTTTRPSVALTPLDESLQGPGDIVAAAGAGPFAVYASTRAHGNPPLQLGAAHAVASAATVLTFTALGQQTSPPSLDFAIGGLPFYAFSADLFDTTSQQDVFSLSWSFGKGPSPLVGSAGSVAFGSTLVESHLYALSLSVGTNAADDSESMWLALAGLQSVTSPVEEPGAVQGVLAGLACLRIAACRLRDRRAGAR